MQCGEQSPRKVGDAIFEEIAASRRTRALLAMTLTRQFRRGRRPAPNKRGVVKVKKLKENIFLIPILCGIAIVAVNVFITPLSAAFLIAASVFLLTRLVDKMAKEEIVDIWKIFKLFSLQAFFVFAITATISYLVSCFPTFTNYVCVNNVLELSRRQLLVFFSPWVLALFLLIRKKIREKLIARNQEV
jgi:hypothetical protein